MDREQSLDPVDVLDTFVDQPTTLTIEPTIVLFGDTWHSHNAPDFRLFSQIRHQGSQQSLDIDVVSLRATRSTINLQTCRVDHVVADAVCFEQAVEPEDHRSQLRSKKRSLRAFSFLWQLASGSARTDPTAPSHRRASTCGD